VDDVHGPQFLVFDVKNADISVFRERCAPMIMVAPDGPFSSSDFGLFFALFLTLEP
jgi:hypothetical protein